MPSFARKQSTLVPKDKRQSMMPNVDDSSLQREESKLDSQMSDDLFSLQRGKSRSLKMPEERPKLEKIDSHSDSEWSSEVQTPYEHTYSPHKPVLALAQEAAKNQVHAKKSIQPS